MSYHERSPTLIYKIRKTTSNNVCGDNFALTIPKIIVERFQNVSFVLKFSGDCIVFQSGCLPTLKQEAEKEMLKILEMKMNNG